MAVLPHKINSSIVRRMRETTISIFSSVFIALLLGNVCSAATYYVSINGSDANPGSKSLPWRTLSHAAIAISSGDTVLVRDGVYRESVILRVGGTASKPVIIKNYPGEHPVIDGSEPITGWVRCRSAADCDGNANWANIYYAYAPAEATAQTANLHQDDHMLALAQAPNPSDPFYLDNLDDYLSVSPANITNTSIVDPRLEAVGAADLIGATIAVWAQSNSVMLRTILDYRPASNKVIFEEIGGRGVYQDRDSKYSVINATSTGVLDSPGEYAFSSTPEADGTHKIYLWPLNNQDVSKSGTVSVSLRDSLVYLNTSHVTIDGFIIQKAVGKAVRTGWTDTYGNTLRNLEVRNCRTDGTGNTIYIYKSHDLLIENNYVHHNAGHSRGIVVSKSSNVRVMDNIVEKVTGTCIFYQGVTKGQITGNLVTASNGVHSNGISTYAACDNILVAGNEVRRSNIAYTMNDSSNITVYNNLFDGYGETSKVAANWGDASGTIAFLNNTIIGSDNNYALFTGSAENAIVENNILEGGGGALHTYNLYTDLSWNQSSASGWYLGEGEIIEEDVSLVFNAPSSNNYTLAGSGPAVDAGNDVSEHLQQLRRDFPSYDFDLDLAGNPRNTGSRVDVGCYEYQDGQQQDPPDEDPPAEDPPAEDPPTEDPPAEDPPAEDPPTYDCIDADFCRVSSGRTAGEDSIKVSGPLLAPAGGIADGTKVDITIQRHYDYAIVYRETVPMSQMDLRRGSYTYRGPRQGISSLKLEPTAPEYDLDIRNVDLTGLTCPFSVVIEAGSYICTSVVTESVANRNRPMPIELLKGYTDSLRVDNARIRRSRRGSTASLSLRGVFSTSQAMSDVQAVVLTLGSQVFTIPADQITATRRGSWRCRNALINEGGTATIKLDPDRSRFYIVLQDVPMSPNSLTQMDSGKIELGMAFTGFNETTDVEL